MGDIYRKVRVCGVDPGKRTRCATVTALIDSGATASVVGEDTARAIGGLRRPNADVVEGRPVDALLARIKLNAPDCGVRERLVIVDDRLLARAGARAEMILGSDYLQRTRAMLMFERDARDERVVCRRSGRRRQA